MDKTILIIASTSELARRTIEELKKSECKIYATSRQTELMDEKVYKLQLDVTNEIDFIHLKDKLSDVKFDTIINFAGYVAAGAVEELDEVKFKKQLDVNLFGLLRIIKHFAPLLKEDGKLVNVSSMASYGIFPFVAPYCISKASSDILLNLYSIESKIKTVSIRPGAVATKFWEVSLENNKEVLEAKSEKFIKEKEFLVQNAQKNSLHALNPIYVAKKIAQIVLMKNPKKVYNIGLDAKLAKFTRFLPQEIVEFIVKTALSFRIKNKK